MANWPDWVSTKSPDVTKMGELSYSERVKHAGIICEESGYKGEVSLARARLFARIENGE